MIATAWCSRTAAALLSTAVLLVPAAATAQPGGEDPGGPAVGQPAPPDRSAAAVVSAELAERRGVELEPAVLDELDSDGSTDFWVQLARQADLSGADGIADWDARGRYVYDRLVESARASQATLTTRLRLAGVAFESYWISNSVLVRGADQAVLDGVLVQPGVAQVRADQVVALPEPVEPDPAGAGVAAVEWGIANIRADQVWSEFGVRGEGIVVGSIDTGVAYTHPALVDQYRGNLGGGAFDHAYSWWDPSGVCPGPEPCDNNSHGTHTTGTMVGDDGAGNQVGVAPGAQWIAAKGCESRSCSEAALLSAGQFMLAPTDLAGGDPRPELRPHVVNNSWSGTGGSSWYDPVVAAWVAAGIFPAFANGNTGPGCGTAGSPADGAAAFAVGAYGSTNEIAGFSSRGPGRGGQVKPDATAPGVAVRSAIPDGYGTSSGTSMAAPHLAGAVALMWSASDRVGDIAATRAAIEGTAVDTDDLSCGGTPADNNVYGQGRLDALEATTVLAVDSGITGLVIDAASDQPLAGVTITGDGVLERRTDQTGRYLTLVRPGTYTLELSRFGYVATSVPGVVVTEGSFTTVDVALAPAPSGAIAGTVTDAASGHTVPGVTVEVLDVPAELTAITGPDGGYEISGVPAGTYRIQITSGRPGVWAPVAPREVTVDGGTTSRTDLALPPVDGISPISVSGDGELGNNPSGGGDSAATMTPDGRYVAFHSQATNLVDQPVGGGQYQVYVHDRTTGVTELVSLSTGGVPSDGDSWKPSISADGRYVTFFSSAGNLVDDPPPTAGASDLRPGIYLRDRVTGRTELLQPDLPGEYTLVDSPRITPDARFAVFESGEIGYADPSGVAELPLPVCDPEPEHPTWSELCGQIYLYDRQTGEPALVSVSSEGEPAAALTQQPVVDASGRYVAFRSGAENLVGGPTNEGDDIFVHDRETGQTEWVSVLESSSGAFGNGIVAPRISDDGRFVVYGRGFVPAAVYDRATAETTLLTVPVDGPPPLLAFSLSPKISADGDSVIFLNAAFDDVQFTPTPGANGVFALDRRTGEVDRVVEFDEHLLGVNLTPWAISDDSRLVLVSSDLSELVPGFPTATEELYLVDRDPAGPRARFAVWDLATDPAAPRPGEPFTVTVSVKNVGDAAGAYHAVPLVDGASLGAAAESVTLAPGESTVVALRLTLDRGGEHLMRVGQATGEVRVQSGTLTGTVTDANDEAPVSGATVVAADGGTRLTTTTLANGTYELADLPVGSWTVTTGAQRYQAVSVEVTLGEDRQEVVRDVALPTGVVAGSERADLTALSGTGGVAGLAVANPGSDELTWSAFGWQATVPDQDPSILVYAHDLARPGPDSYVDQALARLGLDYTGFYGRTCPFGGPADHDLEAFGAALADGDWDLVVVSHECSSYGIPVPILDALHDYVAGGGRLVIGSPQVRSQPDHPLWQALGVRFAERVGFQPPSGLVYWWQPEHPVLDGDLPVPEPTNHPGAASRVEPLAGATALAGYTTTPGLPGMAALVLANEGRTLFRGFSDGGNASDHNRNGIPDGAELWVNTVTQVGGQAAVPWLTASGSGTLDPGGSQQVTVTVDARRLGPGSYSGAVAVVTDAGRGPTRTVPVTVTVVGCDRTITGTRLGELAVTSGVTCLAAGARVIGSVTVHPGAGLATNGATLVGRVSARDATVVSLRDTQVVGPVSVTGATGLVTLEVNRVTGPVTLAGNHTGDTPIVVSGNRITGSLACTGNQPPPTNQGTANTGAGPRTGQCAGL